jgi:NAD(P)-dependent dehydrogenase (short-subunit alcohol dehydrogenase family)
MKILVTGGAGYLGSQLCSILSENNFKVIIYDNLSAGSIIYNKKITLIKGDILHIEWQTKLTGLTTGTYSATLYWNETDDLTTPIQLNVRSLDNTSIFYGQNRRLSVIVANGTGNGSKIYGTGNAQDSDFAAASFALSTVALNWTVDSYIILAGFCGTGTGIRTEFLKVSN